MKNLEIIFGVVILCVGFWLGWLVCNSSPLHTKTEYIANTVTSNIQVPVYRTKYITKTITVDSIIAEYIMINSSNAEKLANNFQKDLLHFEHDTLNITIEPFNINQESINASANLYYRYWTLKLENKAKNIQSDDFNISLDINLSKNNLNLNINKQIWSIFNVPILLGVGVNL